MGSEDRIASLLYVSTALLPPGESDAVVDAIVDSALERNRQLDVTGALVFTQRNFAQYLEGPQQGLDRLMDSIRQDRRHRDVAIVYEGRSDIRRFPIWSLAYAGPSTFVAAHVRALVAHPSGPAARKGSERLIDLMRQFVEAQLIERKRTSGDD